MTPLTEKKISEYISINGESALLELISKTTDNKNKFELTIIANAGVHPLQDCHKRGEIFIASTGNINFTTSNDATSEIKEILIKVAKKLQSKPWQKVYIAPFGPAILSMCIKSLVYRILNQETIDILHAGDGRHFDIAIDIRNIAVTAGTMDSIKETQDPSQD